jgi:hypothetical protein
MRDQGAPQSSSARVVSPEVVVVAEISSPMVREETRGRPRQFMEMKPHILCSMVLHRGTPTEQPVSY